MFKRLRSQIQAIEMSFLCRETGLGLKDRGRRSDIRRELGEEPMFLCVEKEPVEVVQASD